MCIRDSHSADGLPHQSFSSINEMKTAIVKSMTETTSRRSHCQFITFITFLFTVNVIRQMAPLFSKVNSNKLWHDIKNEQSVISAKFGKDLFNIFKVIGRKTKWPQFFGLPVRCKKTFFYVFIAVTFLRFLTFLFCKRFYF